ncbi:hypothetical protein SBA3_2940013 [Candidatus Sulfopaludibacter sp. SbA3]|nr:hypothetical protein SBA3_2940013 [Candidatus Sulfopaludibacter sp. SbA3]
MADAPVGTVIAFAGFIEGGGEVPPKIVTVENAWALCNGVAVPRLGQFSALFNVIHEIYGTGDGQNTFNLPDYRGQFLRGADLGAGVDKDLNARKQPPNSVPIGDLIGTIQVDQIGHHDHDISPNPHAHPFITRAAAQGDPGNEPASLVGSRRAV